jgi:SAM-dependent methyltransferase
MKSYDDTQKTHYDRVAKELGASPASTMPDQIVRGSESSSIVSAVSRWLRDSGSRSEAVSIADLGCGNGTTLALLANAFPASRICGVEYNSELLRIAQLVQGVEVVWGDLVDASSLPPDKFDVVILQRVLHVIMSKSAQVVALENIVDLLKPGGLLVAIEAFETGLQYMNEARTEFNLPAVKMPHHNLFLPDEFFLGSGQLERIDCGVSEHVLSSHYYLSYVVYPALVAATGGDFNRNSIFVKMLSPMLPNVGEFGSNRFLTFKRH